LKEKGSTYSNSALEISPWNVYVYLPYSWFLNFWDTLRPFVSYPLLPYLVPEKKPCMDQTFQSEMNGIKELCIQINQNPENSFQKQ